MEAILEKIDRIYSQPETVLYSGFASESEGFSLPDRDRLELLEVNSDNIEAIRQKYGNLVINLVPSATNNYLLLDSSSKFKTRFIVEFAGSNNLAIIGKDLSCSGNVAFKNDNGIFVVGGETKQQCKLSIKLLGIGSTFFFGRYSSANGLTCVMNGENTKVIIGDDCMFAKDIWIRNSDMHSIFDLESGAWLNPASDIVIAPHVWVGQDSLILKNTEIGFGSIIGAKSLVNKKIPKCSLAAGIPAKKIKDNVSWDRRIEPRQNKIEYVRNLKDKFA